MLCNTNVVIEEKTRVTDHGYGTLPMPIAHRDHMKTTPFFSLYPIPNFYRYQTLIEKLCYCLQVLELHPILPMSSPTIVFGAGFVGVNFATPSELQALLDFLRKHNITRVDTARRYPAINSGRSEQLLGEVEAAGQGFTIDTKIKVVGSDASGSLTAAKIKESVVESLEALRVDEVGEPVPQDCSQINALAESNGPGKCSTLSHARPRDAH